MASRAGFRFYLITDRRAIRGGDLIAACEAALAGARSAAPPGAVALQLREKELSARELYGLAIRLRSVCARYGAPMLVNDRADVAIAAGADGVHLPSDSIGAAGARKLLGPDRLIGVSVHSAAEIASVARDVATGAGADFAVFGPVFDPISKAPAGRAQGVEGLAAACRTATIPVFAIGGITPDRAREVLAAGAVGVAGIGAILSADSPADAMRAMLAALNLRPDG